jgi:hypothetical protein
MGILTGTCRTYIESKKALGTQEVFVCDKCSPTDLAEITATTISSVAFAAMARYDCKNSKLSLVSPFYV